jgi:hypothetical protein
MPELWACSGWSCGSNFNFPTPCQVVEIHLCGFPSHPAGKPLFYILIPGPMPLALWLGVNPLVFLRMSHSFPHPLSFPSFPLFPPALAFHTWHERTQIFILEKRYLTVANTEPALKGKECEEKLHCQGLNVTCNLTGFHLCICHSQTLAL